MALTNVKFMISCPSKEFWPDESLPEFVMIGKSNVGKSTFINFLCQNSTIAKVSSTPGHTKLLNFFNVNNEFRLVDAPGYGFAYANKQNDQSFAKMMEEYLFERKNLKGCCLLVDSRRAPSEDDAVMFNMLIDAQVPFIIVATKCDKLNQSEKSKVIKNIVSRFTLNSSDNIFLSGLKNYQVIEEVTEQIYQMIKEQE